MRCWRDRVAERPGEHVEHSDAGDAAEVVPLLSVRTFARLSSGVYNNDDQPWSFYRDLDCTTLIGTLAPGHFYRDAQAFSWK